MVASPCTDTLIASIWRTLLWRIACSATAGQLIHDVHSVLLGLCVRVADNRVFGKSVPVHVAMIVEDHGLASRCAYVEAEQIRLFHFMLS